MASKPPTAARNPAWVWPVMIAVSALVLRIIYLFQARAHDPLFYAPQMDALYHHQWASAIAGGQEFIRDAYFRAPLYPLFLGLIYKVFGTSLVAARAVQAVIGCLSCVLLYLNARRWFGEPVGRAAGLVMAVYPLAVYFDGELLIANLLVFLLLLGFWLLGRARDRDRQWYLPGLAFGLAAIARPNVLAVITVLAVWLLWTRVRRWTRVAQFLAAAAIVIAPVTIRNYVKSQRFVLIAWQGGTNFYIGNNPNSDGITAVVPGTRESWWGGYNDVKRLAEQNLGRELKGSEIDAYWLQQGFKFWREQPLAALKLLARKTYLWLSGYEVSNNRDIYFFKRFTFLNLLLFQTPALKFPFGLALPFALLGIWYSRKRWRELLPEFLFLAAFSASFIIFFVTARYRMPVVVLLIPFAVHGIMRLFRTSGRGLTAALVPLVLGFVLFNFNFAGIGTPNMAQNFFIAAKGLHDSGDRTAAGEMLVQALKRDSASNILSLEVTMAMEQGHYDRAQRAARAALRLWPTRADGWGIAGNVAATMGQLDTAEVYFRKAIELDPYSVQALNNLGNIATQRNDYPQARRYYDQALAIDPNFTTALFQLGYLDYREGNKPKAHELWQRVLQLEPGNAKARQALQQLR